MNGNASERENRGVETRIARAEVAAKAIDFGMKAIKEVKAEAARLGIVLDPEINPARLVCARCQIMFKQRRKGQKFCSQKCRRLSWEEKREGTATVSEAPAPVLGIVLVMGGRSDAVPCGFCHRMNRVDLSRNGRQNALCRCGARYFAWLRRVQGRPVLEQGWKKGRERWMYL